MDFKSSLFHLQHTGLQVAFALTILFTKETFLIQQRKITDKTFQPNIDNALIYIS